MAAPVVETTVRRLLDRVSERFYPLGPDAYVAVEKLLRSSDLCTDSATLSRALASVFARSSEEWEAMRATIAAALEPERVAVASRPVGEAPTAPAAERRDAGSTGLGGATRVVVIHSERRWRHRVWSAAARVRRGARRLPAKTWLWCLGGALVVAAAVWVVLLLQTTVSSVLPPKPPDAPALSSAAPPEPEVEERCLRDPTPVVGPKEVSVPPVARKQPPPWIFFATVGLFALVLGAVGVRLWDAPRIAAKLDDRRRADGLRRRRESAADDAGPADAWPAYLVPELPLPIPEGAAIDAAQWLGRLHQPGHPIDLDIDRTIAQTIERGGEPHVVLAPRKIGVPLLVLLDVEEGAHPWSGPASRLLAFWRRLGVPMDVFYYADDPGDLSPADRPAERCTATDLARRHGEQPLLVISRIREGLERVRNRRASRFAKAFGPWERVAWLDPDPRSVAEWGRQKESIARRLAARRAVRYPLTGEAVVAMARALAGVPTAGPVPSAPPLPEPSAPDVGEALRLWATAASLVPDATWDQLEHLRHHFPSIHGALQHPGAIRRLVEWIAAQAGEPFAETCEDGAKIRIPQAVQERIIRDQLQRERRGSTPPGFAREACKILLSQVDPAPAGSRAALYADLKRAAHLVHIDSARARELFQSLQGSEIDHEVRQVLAALSRTLGGGLGEAGAGEVTALAKGDRVPLRSLLGARASEWLRPLVAGFIVGATALGMALAAAVGLGVGALAAKRTGASPLPRYEVPGVFGCRLADVSSATDLRPAMIPIDPGEFLMGSPEDEPDRFDDERQHLVRLTRPYSLSETEVTQGQYEAVIGSNPSDSDTCRGVGVGKELPVTCVSWTDAVAFCNRLSEREGLRPCYDLSGDAARWSRPCTGYRLPTEAEWEYGARSGETGARYGALDDVAWYSDNSDSKVHRVGTKAANAKGLRDVLGNVYEWCWDWYGEYPSADSVTDPGGPDSGRRRVLRGGSWGDEPRGARLALRIGVGPSSRDVLVGFRLARSVP